LGRILAIDYGRKRVGIAVTDPLQLVANGLTTLHPDEVFTFLSSYFKQEEVEEVVVGDPRQLDMRESEAAVYSKPFLRKFRQEFPGMTLRLYDERFTSRIAQQALIEGKAKKKTRQDKPLRDKMSATILLTSYMEHVRNAGTRARPV
jgi:putative Holliday junction resolvase